MAWAQVVHDVALVLVPSFFMVYVAHKLLCARDDRDFTKAAVVKAVSFLEKWVQLAEFYAKERQARGAPIDRDLAIRFLSDGPEYLSVAELATDAQTRAKLDKAYKSVCRVLTGHLEYKEAVCHVQAAVDAMRAHITK